MEVAPCFDSELGADGRSFRPPMPSVTEQILNQIHDYSH